MPWRCPPLHRSSPPPLYHSLNTWHPHEQNFPLLPTSSLPHAPRHTYTHTRPTHPSSSSPACPLSRTPGIFRYRSPHYSSIQPRQTHKQISRLRRSQSLSALSESCTPVRYEPGAELNAACRHLTIPDPPKNPHPAPQCCLAAAHNTIKSHLQNARL